MKNLKIILQCNKLLIFLYLLATLYIIIFTIVIKYESKYNGNENNLTGKILSYNINGNKLKINIKAKEEVIVNYYFNSEEELNETKKEITIGKMVDLKGEFSKPKNNTIPNTFNYQKYLYNNQIYYIFNASKINIYGNNNIFEKAKDYLIKRAYNLKNSDYILLLVLGDKALISNEEYNIYKNNGTAHLLAISGMHIAVILLALNFIFKKDNLKKLIIISAILLFFAYITNNSISINRAIYFYILNSINKKFNLKYSSLQILLFTAILIIFINPFAIYDLGFLYSFSVCFGILFYKDKINGNKINTITKVSTIAFLFSLPINCYINYEINLTTILINIIFVPLISYFVFPLAILTFILPLLNPLLDILLSITNILNTFGDKISIFINIPKIPLIFVITMYIFLILMKKNKKWLIINILIIIIFIIKPYLNTNHYIYYLDVGQGDSILIVYPHNKAILIDTGGKIVYSLEDWQKNNKGYNISDNTISFLKSIGINKLEYLILTHGDYDHAGEALNLINNIKIKNVIFNNGEYNNLELDIIKLLKSKKINYYQNLKTINIKNNLIYFLNNKLYNNENDNSILLYSIINNYKFLYMGDAGLDVEENIINNYKINNIDFLKVGHHGSNTSSSIDFINSIKPKYAIISVGENNRYNHPNIETLNNLSLAKIYRTDIDGTIKIKINKNDYKINTYPPY